MMKERGREVTKEREEGLSWEERGRKGRVQPDNDDKESNFDKINYGDKDITII